jgi:hypothetical protein
VPFSEARVFRTDKGFIIKDKDDDEWCKYIPFDDLDRIKTEVAYRTLKPEQITAMKDMPTPSLKKYPKDLLDDIEISFEKLCSAEEQPEEEEEVIRPSVITGQQPDNSFHSKNRPYAGPADAIQRWVDQGKKAIRSLTPPLKISSIRVLQDSDDDQEPDNQSTNSTTTILTKHDVIKHHFGTLTPFIQDYTRDQYEVEEEHTIHLPSIPTFNKFGPLSYQRSVLQDDPVTQEDFDDIRLKEIQITNLKEEETPSLLDSYLLQQKPITTTPVKKRKQNQSSDKDVDIIQDSDTTDSEIDIWDILLQSMPPYLLLKGVLSIFFLFVMSIGFVLNANISIILFLFFIFIQLSTTAFHDACQTFNNFIGYFTKKDDKRPKFTNKKGSTTRPVLDINTLTLKTKTPSLAKQDSEVNIATISMNPLDGLCLQKPEGSAASSKRVNRTYSIRPAQPSEARIIQTVDNQHYFKTIFFDSLSKLALYDPGACCCAISRKFLKELQTYGYVPLQDSSLKVEGAVGGAKEEVKQIAYLDFKLETGYTIHDVPFMILETGGDVLIGNNLIRAHRWANCWKNSNFYIDIGQDKTLVPTYSRPLPPDRPINTVAISKINVYPSETTTIGLGIPHMGSKSLNNFKRRDLLTSALDNSLDDRLEIYPTLTRLKNNEIQVVVKNKSDTPFPIYEGMELASVKIAPPQTQVSHIEELHHAKKIYNSIPRIHTNECHCQIQDNLDEKEVAIKMLIADRLGYTSLGLVTDLDKTETLEPGFKFIENSKITKSPLLLAVADEEGSLAHIDDIKIKKAFNQVKEFTDRTKKTPLFFFLDPLQKLAFTSRLTLNSIFRKFKFSFFPVRPWPDHSQCIRPAIHMNKPELFTGITKTRIHIQNGPASPFPDSLQREHGTPLVQIPFYNSTLFMFKYEQTLNCHLHVHLSQEKDQYLTESERNRLITSLLVELRYLRIPHQVQITTDGYDSITGSKLTDRYLQQNLKQIAMNLSPFYEPAILTQWPSRLSEDLPITIDIISDECFCSLCITDFNFKPNEVILYDGDINNLICSAPFPSPNGWHSSKSTHSTSSKITPSLKAILASILDVSDDFDTDQPLDYMELCDENELQTFLNTHPGTEADGEDTHDLPPPQPSNPELFKDFDMVGIPDQFRPGDWRNTDIMDRLQNVSPAIREQFGQLLDKHRMVISYFDNNCRPVLFRGKPAVVDVDLTTDEPIFMKPYMVSGVAVDMLDSKIDELLERNEIHPIESKYNVAIILTHHNSSQKHVEGQSKKVRMVLDLRNTNAIIKDKNLHSYLVKKIEILFMTIHGSSTLTSVDISKAYRALVASFKLQQICAFRTPSSRKYPHVTWAFRSACDGLANLPGYYSYIMQDALSIKAKQFTIAHIDDLLIFSKSDEEHLDHLDTVLTDLGKCNFMISAKKLQPFQRQINFLGHMLDGFNKWIPDDRKSYFDLLEPPKTKKQLQSLLGVANYMGNFIDSYAMIAGPLYDAMRGKTDKTPIELNDIQMKSFLELKNQIAKAPKLSLLDTSRTIYMECDASLVGTGSVLYHEKEVDGKITREIIRYGSRRFSLTESLNHTSLEREAMAILIGVKQHMSFLEACPEAVIKTDLKSLITLLSCYNNPASSRFAIISHRLYALPFKWSLIHSPGIDIPLADMLSRIHKPYVCCYTDRHLRYPDLKRDNIMMPPEWRDKPNLVLTTADLLEAMRQQIVFVEKSSNNVKEKRLKALINEVSLQFSELTDSKNQLAALLEDDLSRVRNNIQKDQEAKKLSKAKISALTAVDPDLLITSEFIRKYQSENPKLANIITMLRTLPLDKLPKSIYHTFRLLNDSILVTRKNKQLDFSEISNLRIVCDSRMTIHILSLLHVMNGHCGMNTLNLAFSNTYKGVEKSTQGFVKLVCNACRSCRYHRQTNKKVVPLGRIPIPSTPNDTWMVDFLVFKQEQTFKGRKIAAAFNVVDLYSNLFISYPVKDQTSTTVIDCFKRIFAQLNVPRRIVSDNATSLCRNPEVLTFLKANNVKEVVTITAYNSQANKVERMQKTFRDTLKLVQETFKRSTIFDMYDYVVKLMNKRPLSLSLHPHIKEICSQLKQTPGVVTPFSLHFGIPPSNDIIDPKLLDPVTRDRFIQKWKHILTEYDRLLQIDLEKRRLEKPKPRVIKVGDLVILKNNVAHKESLRFYKNIYEVTSIHFSKYKITPLFFKGRIVETNGDNLKLYESSELLRQLPSKLRNLLGENTPADELKRLSTENPDFLPEELQSWALPSTMSLRNRLTPRDKFSEPALSLLNTDMISDSSDSSSSLFTVSDNLPDFRSELSSLLKRQGAPQLKTTPSGLTIKQYTIPAETKINNSPTTETGNVDLRPISHPKLVEAENPAIRDSISNKIRDDPNRAAIKTKESKIEITPNTMDRSKLENKLPSRSLLVNSPPPSLTSNITIRKRTISNPPVRNTIRPFVDPVSTPVELETLPLDKLETPTPNLENNAQTDQTLTPPTNKQDSPIITPDIANDNLDTSSPQKVDEPLVNDNKLIPEPIDNDQTITKEINTKKIGKTRLKNTEIPADSIKHRLRSATLKPFKFLKK